MKEKTLKEKTVSGLSWSAADKLFQQLFVFVSGVLLARMLDKENYGLIGVLAIFTGMANLLQESGFTTALIRKKNPTQSDYITVFYTNIFIGFTLYIVLFFLAPIISSYYNQPILAPLARFLFLSFLFNSFAIIQNAKLLKEINYKLITKINFFSVLISYSIALLLAYFGYGVWALASQIVVISLIRSACLWIFGKWKPAGHFSGESFKEFFAFGSKLVIGGVLNSFSTNIPQNIIAKQYSLGITGLYNQATKLHNTVFDFLAGTIQSVPFTVLSNIDDNVRLKKAVRKFIRAKAFIVFPLFIGMILVSKPFIISLLRVGWADTVPILQLLCLGGLFASLDSSNTDLLRVKGKSGKILSLEIFRNVLILFVIVISLSFKLDYLYLVGGLSLTYFIKYVVSSYICNKDIDYKMVELLKDLSPYFATTLLAVVCGYMLQYLIGNFLLLTIFQIILVALIYISILYFFGSVIVRDAIGVLTKTILKTK
ncbi:O-antigen/teichoic acid export membrane protein [Dysgonomonas alginatilytica]|uniref:O-antigen/teichoic acid export membrane protein n=1 Tax=Dysgonomonas alginatilytica TaxID=1605892 RepID=A0A2V3PN84_9BACT|nr:lipopolysaccharide biosynthesis protein [Dysgonomonas alginatilytica]PXV62508.1 O-antigen/teichoic acid export membrane protein [Dysgonomonas alginatilytica]